MIAPLLKPKDQKRKRKPYVMDRRDGKEVCDKSTEGGRIEYRTRTLLMFRRQKGICRWCGMPMIWESATFDHDNGRTKGNQDDRIEVEGRWQNAAVHGECNGERGSIRHLTRAGWLASKQGQGSHSGNKSVLRRRLMLDQNKDHEAARECVCEGEFPIHCGPECNCWHHDEAVREVAPTEPKFKVGQVVVVTSIKIPLPIRIREVVKQDDEWFYAFDKKYLFPEHMLRELTPKENGGV